MHSTGRNMLVHGVVGRINPAGVQGEGKTRRKPRTGRNLTLPPKPLPASGARIVLNPQQLIFRRRCELGQLALRRQCQGCVAQTQVWWGERPREPKLSWNHAPRQEPRPTKRTRMRFGQHALKLRPQESQAPMRFSEDLRIKHKRKRIPGNW